MGAVIGRMLAHHRGRLRRGGSPVAVAPRALRIGASGWLATVVVTGYPREVFPGWLAPLTNHGALLDCALHIDPIDPLRAATRLRRQLARLESGRRSSAEHGRLADPQVEAATEDAYALAERVARGEGRLYTLTLTLTVHAGSADELAAEVAAVRALCASLLLEAHPTTYRAVAGWTTSLPIGLNPLTDPTRGGADGRVLDTAALAAAFPFSSPDLPSTDGAPPGVLYGHNLGSHGLVFWDRFACDNYNSVVLGRSGSGKSYLVKLELLRSLYRDIDAQVIDPEDEYARLAGAVGGTVVRLGAAGVRLNPFDLPIHDRRDGARVAARDAFTRRVLFVHTFCAVALGATPAASERAVLDTAITATYRRSGITADPRTWNQPAPLLRDLHATLLALADPHTPAETSAETPVAGPVSREAVDAAVDGPDTAGTGATADEPDAAPAGSPPRAERAGGGDEAAVARGLATRLRPFVDGAYGGLFAGPTSTSPGGHLVVWSLRELAEELKPVAILMALDAIWREVTTGPDRRRRLITVDEAWLLLARPEGAQFLLRAAKSARKYWAGLTVATQDTADVLSSDLGRAVVTNAATQILLRQAPQAIEQVTATFSLSAGERAFLLGAERGDGLLAAGQARAAFTATASDFEDELITTDPGELADTATADEWVHLDSDPAAAPDHERHDPGHEPGRSAGVADTGRQPC